MVVVVFCEFSGDACSRCVWSCDGCGGSVANDVSLQIKQLVLCGAGVARAFPAEESVAAEVLQVAHVWAKSLPWEQMAAANAWAAMVPRVGGKWFEEFSTLVKLGKIQRLDGEPVLLSELASDPCVIVARPPFAHSCKNPWFVNEVEKMLYGLIAEFGSQFDDFSWLNDRAWRHGVVPSRLTLGLSREEATAEAIMVKVQRVNMDFTAGITYFLKGSDYVFNPPVQEEELTVDVGKLKLFELPQGRTTGPLSHCMYDLP